MSSLHEYNNGAKFLIYAIRSYSATVSIMGVWDGYLLGK
jgi:hypothetical protein